MNVNKEIEIILRKNKPERIPELDLTLMHKGIQTNGLVNIVARSKKPMGNDTGLNLKTEINEDRIHIATFGMFDIISAQESAVRLRHAF